jgi:hypothetical protein
MRRFRRTGERLPAHCMLGGWGAPQRHRQKSKGKAKAGSGGAGGGPATKAAGSSGQASSSQSSNRPSAPLARITGLSTEEDAVQVGLPLAAEAATKPEPPPAGGGGTKKDKERLRKERQRQRKMEEAWEALRGAVELMEETAGTRGVDAVEEAMHAAAKHEACSEPLAALVAVARELIEQARAAEAERARVAAEAAAAEAAERLSLEEQAVALTLRMQSDALMLQQVQAQLGVPPAAPAEETLCVVWFDAPKDLAFVPCGHVCVCGACAEQLTKTRTPTCPVCRRAIQQTTKVFCS